MLNFIFDLTTLFILNILFWMYLMLGDKVWVNRVLEDMPEEFSEKKKDNDTVKEIYKPIKPRHYSTYGDPMKPDGYHRQSYENDKKFEDEVKQIEINNKIIRALKDRWAIRIKYIGFFVILLDIIKFIFLRTP